MKRIIFTASLFFSSLTGFTQASRTWVSGVGDDVNPCSRTAPCKTFAGAISKTATTGEINAIDAGGYGAVTITRSITIDGGGTFASVLGAMTNGVIINAPDGIVTLRRLNINGVGNGISGIKIVAARKVIIENCIIANFTKKGIEASAGCSLLLNDVTIQNTEDAIFMDNGACVLSAENCRFQASKNAGINISAGRAALNRCNVSDCSVAIMAAENSKAALSGNFISGNGTVSQSKGTVSSANDNILSGNGLPGNSFSPMKMQ